MDKSGLVRESSQLGVAVSGLAGVASLGEVLAWIDGDLLYQPWHARGLHLQADTSVFQSEAIALEMAVAWVNSTICNFQQWRNV